MSTSRQLPPELWVMTLDLFLADSPGLFQLHVRLATLRQVCKAWQVFIDSTNRFWTRISSQCPLLYIKTALTKSGPKNAEGLPLCIEFYPRASDVDVELKRPAREFVELTKALQSYRSRMSTLYVNVPMRAVRTLLAYLKKSGNQVQKLSVSIIPDAQEQRFANSSRPYSTLNLLGGESSFLKELILLDLPVRFEPSKLNFPKLRKLQLSGRIRLSFTSLKSFLERDLQLESLELTNIASTEPIASSASESIQLPHLRSLKLEELATPINLISFFLALHLPNCRTVHVAFALDQEPFSEEVFNAVLERLEVKIAATVRTFPVGDTQLTSYVRLEKHGGEYRWWTEPIETGGGPAGLRIGLRLKEEEVFEWGDSPVTSATKFCRFVRQALDGTGHQYAIKLNTLHWLSGPSFGLCSQAFSGADLIDLRANIVNDYFGCLSAFVTTRASRCRFPNLRGLHLTGIAEVKVDGHEESLRGLEQFARTLVDGGYVTSDRAFKVTLCGRFTISMDAWKTLEKGRKIEGVEIDYSAASLRAERGGILYHGGRAFDRSMSLKELCSLEGAELL
ncbi:hypothetical protein FRB90_012496 [Tulasnella sp. 427]|nr:hypothetical protein FRB90_012496 [Tulasnella sp. 427]